MKRIITIALCFCLGTVAHSDIVGVDIEGHLYKTNNFNMSLPADGPQIGDRLSLYFTYDTALLEYYSGTSPYDGRWNAYYDGPAILDFDLTVTRNSRTIYEIIDFGPYHADLLSIYNNGLPVYDEVIQGVSFLMRDPLTQVFPGWRSQINFVLSNLIEEYQDPFAPSIIIDPDIYSTQELKILYGYWFTPGAAEKNYSYTFQFDAMDVRIIPEPATLALLAVGAVGILRKRKI